VKSDESSLPPDGEIRWNRGRWIFRDETLRRLEILLDEAFGMPGTKVRFRIDGIIGLAPGLGDVLRGLLSLVVPLAAWLRGDLAWRWCARRRISALAVLVGTIPLFGDIFDISGRQTDATGL